LLGEEDLPLLLDENGMPIEGDPVIDGLPPLPGKNAPTPLDDAFIDRALGRRPPPSASDGISNRPQ